MPVYVYRCPAGHEFEQVAGREDALAPCQCGETARRRPFSGVPNISGETVARPGVRTR